MNRNHIINFFLFILLSLACGTSAPAAQQLPEAKEAAPIPKDEPAHPEQGSAGTPQGEVTSLHEAEKAVVRIVTQGAYEYPEFGKHEGSGSGSGFIIDPDGIAVTNNHVVSGAALIDVYFSGDPNPHRARLLGTSECADLAVIDIEGEEYPYFKWYTKDPQLGLEVYSLGYPLGDQEFSQHKGVISKRSASGETNWSHVDEVVEHDAIINPGSTGGPLVTEDGKVVGVNYASLPHAHHYYAITYAESKDVLESLQDGEDVLSMGINGEAFLLEDGSSGIWIYSVKSGSTVDKSGVQPGDILTTMEGITLAKNGTMAEYCGILRSHNVEDALDLTVTRWKSNKILEGQLNGRKMAVAGSPGENSLSQSAGTGNPYYLEEFDGDLSLWQWFLMNGDENLFELFQEEEHLVFNLHDTNIWSYLINNEWNYTNVRIDTEATNRGQNTNNVSLICRYSDDGGWYEFNIFNSGLYKILVFDGRRSEYRMLADGGSNAIKIGKQTNAYSAVCMEDQLTLYINGERVRTVTDGTLSEGRVGLSVSSFDYIPVTVDFEWVEMSQP